MALSPKVYTLLCGCFAALGSTLFGYDLGVIASVLEAPDFLHKLDLEDPLKQDSVKQNYLGFVTSSMLLGAFFGCIPAALAADRFSRRTAITAAAVIFIVGGVLQTAAMDKGMMIAGRALAGFAIGMMALLVPLYQSEISLPAQRGRLTTLQQFFLGWGAFIAGWIGYACTKHSLGTALQWRLPLGFQVVPAVPLLFVTLVLPESPRWLMIKGREAEALDVLARLHAHGDENDPLVLGEFHEMKSKVKEEAAVQSGWRDIFLNKSNLRKVALGVVLQFSVQMTGVSFLQYYAPTIYKAVGYSTETTLLLNSINSVLSLCMQFTVCAWVDRVGRRWPLIIANTLSGTLFIFVMWITIQFDRNQGTAHMGRAFVAVCWLWNMSFAPIGSLSWAYPVEIMNTAIRAKGTALTSMACWIANFMIGQVSPEAFARVGWRYYLLFVICGFTNALTMWAFFPETKGRTLEEMDYYFDNTHWFVPLAKTEHVSANEREKELARREAMRGEKAVAEFSDAEEKGRTNHGEMV